jgi:hypothetical protein
MLERREGLADSTKHDIQQILVQTICPRVSATTSDQSTQLGRLSHPDPRYRSGIKEGTTTQSSVD